MSKRPEWDEFERVIEKLQKAFYPDAVVTRNEKILGQLSNKKRQCDVVIRQKVGTQDLLIVAECKKWNKNVGPDTVSSLVITKEDIKADIAMIITSKGFTSGAREIADKKQISLYTFRDTESESWPNGLRVPVEIEAWMLAPSNIYILDMEGKRIDVRGVPIVKLRLGPYVGELNVGQIFRSSWHQISPKREGRMRGTLKVTIPPKSNNQITIKFDVVAKLKKVLREGRFHFQGLVKEGQSIAHTKKFRIDVGGPASEYEKPDQVFVEEGGYGIILDTVLLEGHDAESLRVKRFLYDEEWFVEAEAKSRIEIPVD